MSTGFPRSYYTLPYGRFEFRMVVSPHIARLSKEKP